MKPNAILASSFSLSVFALFYNDTSLPFSPFHSLLLRRHKHFRSRLKRDCRRRHGIIINEEKRGKNMKRKRKKDWGEGKTENKKEGKSET